MGHEEEKRVLSPEKPCKDSGLRFSMKMIQTLVFDIENLVGPSGTQNSCFSIQSPPQSDGHDLSLTPRKPPGFAKQTESGLFKLTLPVLNENPNIGIFDLRTHNCLPTRCPSKMAMSVFRGATQSPMR